MLSYSEYFAHAEYRGNQAYSSTAVVDCDVVGGLLPPCSDVHGLTDCYDATNPRFTGMARFSVVFSSSAYINSDYLYTLSIAFFD